MSAGAGRAGRQRKRKSCIDSASDAEGPASDALLGQPERIVPLGVARAGGLAIDASAGTLDKAAPDAAGQAIPGGAEPAASSAAEPAGFGEAQPGASAAAQPAGLGEAQPGARAGGDALLAAADLLGPEDYQLGHKLNAGSPAGAFLKFDRGSSDHPGTTDLDSWKRWKDLVRCWVGPNMTVHNCEALLSCCGAVPGNMRRRIKGCPRSEQFFGWCVAFYADRKRGRWCYWPLAWRLWALSYARQLSVCGRMVMAPSKIWTEVVRRHRLRGH